MAAQSSIAANVAIYRMRIDAAAAKLAARVDLPYLPLTRCKHPERSLEFALGRIADFLEAVEAAQAAAEAAAAPVSEAPIRVSDPVPVRRKTG